MVHACSYVVSGSAQCVVTATGAKTFVIKRRSGGLLPSYISWNKSRLLNRVGTLSWIWSLVVLLMLMSALITWTAKSEEDDTYDTVCTYMVMVMY